MYKPIKKNIMLLILCSLFGLLNVVLGLHKVIKNNTFDTHFVVLDVLFDFIIGCAFGIAIICFILSLI